MGRQFRPGEMRVHIAGTRARRTADATGVARQATAAATLAGGGIRTAQMAAGTPGTITGTTDANTRRKRRLQRRQLNELQHHRKERPLYMLYALERMRRSC